MPGLIHPSRRSFKPFKLRSRPSLVMACRFFGSVPDFPSPPRLHYPRSDGLLAAPRLHRFPVPLDTPPPVEVRPRGYCPPQRTDRTYMYNRIHSQTDAVSPPTSHPRSEKGPKHTTGIYFPPTSCSRIRNRSRGPTKLRTPIGRGNTTATAEIRAASARPRAREHGPIVGIGVGVGVGVGGVRASLQQ